MASRRSASPDRSSPTASCARRPPPSRRSSRAQQRVAVWARSHARVLRGRGGGRQRRRRTRSDQPQARPHRARARAHRQPARCADRRARRRSRRSTSQPRRLAVDLERAPRRAAGDDAADDEDPALIVYTSGTTGRPKGAVLPRRAIASNLDALAEAWAWTGEDVLVHGLPLFHVHGLVLGLFGPLRLGGALRHLGGFDPDAAAAALRDGGTMLFGVPTMYHRTRPRGRGGRRRRDRRRAARRTPAGLGLGRAAGARVRAHPRA